MTHLLTLTTTLAIYIWTNLKTYIRRAYKIILKNALLCPENRLVRYHYYSKITVFNLKIGDDRQIGDVLLQMFGYGT